MDAFRVADGIQHVAESTLSHPGAGLAPVERAKLPPFQVVRTGRAFGHGDSSPFPKKRTADVVFGEGFLFGETRGDGFFEVARSKDGRRLYTKLATDDGIESNAIFELKTEGVLPGDAVLQMVDGYVEVVPELDPGLGSPTVRSVDGSASSSNTTRPGWRCPASG